MSVTTYWCEVGDDLVEYPARGPLPAGSYRRSDVDLVDAGEHADIYGDVNDRPAIRIANNGQVVVIEGSLDDLAAFARTVLEQVDARRAGPDAD